MGFVLFEYSEKNPPKQISTTISLQEKKAINGDGYAYNDLILLGYMIKKIGFDFSIDEMKAWIENGWTLNDLIRRGMQTMSNNETIIQRLATVEKKIADLERKTYKGK